MTCRRLPVFAAVVAVATLAACATWSRHGIKFHPPQKLRLAVLPIREIVSVKRFRDIHSAEPKASAPEREMIRDEVHRAANDLLDDLENRLQKSYFFDVQGHRDVESVLDEWKAEAATSPVTSEDVALLEKTLHADAFLDVRIAGYGRIKKKWTAYMIGSGFVEGTVEGIAAGGLTGNPVVGLVVGLEEVGQEILVWSGASALVNSKFTPVILEGYVFNRSGQRVWAKTVFATQGKDRLKAYPKAERKKKEIRLRTSLDKAAEDLARALETSAWENLKKG